MKPEKVESLQVRASYSIRDAIIKMDTGRRGIVLVVDARQRLLGTITDGDVRRAILDRVALDDSVEVLLSRKSQRYATPITAVVGMGAAEHLQIMKEHRIQHLPIVDRDNCVQGLVTLAELMPDEPGLLSAVVMAGGQGTRLSPLTEETPKPMLPVGDRPLMAHILQRLREANITDVSVTTHHKAEKIKAHFGDGGKLGLKLNYVTEEEPLGTAGGIGLLGPLRGTQLVINGDILTEVDFRLMLAFHREHQADLTVAVRSHEVKVPFGVVECNGPVVTGLSEKRGSFFVNAGIYMLEPSATQLIPRGVRFDMTDLIQQLLREKRTVISFPVREEWLDIGQHSDYARAQEQAKQWSGQ